MKLNKKGMELFDTWRDKYYGELERMRKETGDPDWIEGWCIIDTPEYEHDINDVIGVMIFGDDDDAIYHILENFSAKEEYAFGYTAAEVVEMMKPYFDINEDEDDLTWELDKTTFYIDCGDGTYTHGEWVDREAAESFCKSARACGDNLTVIGTEPPVGYERVGA